LVDHKSRRRPNLISRFATLESAGLYDYNPSIKVIKASVLQGLERSNCYSVRNAIGRFVNRIVVATDSGKTQAARKKSERRWLPSHKASDDGKVW
jgi:hypothetical protein